MSYTFRPNIKYRTDLLPCLIGKPHLREGAALFLSLRPLKVAPTIQRRTPLDHRRIEVPPPGWAIAVWERLAALIASVGLYLPSAKAVRKGRRPVAIRYLGMEAHLSESGRSRWCSESAEGGMVTLPSVNEDRRNDVTESNPAK
jgi:hypothetical protein